VLSINLHAFLIGIMSLAIMNMKIIVYLEVKMTTIVNLLMTVVGGTVLLGWFGLT